MPSLVAGGVQPGDVVAIYTPRQFGLIVSMVAGLLSGGVFVLIDPYLPIKRKLMLLQEAGAKWLIVVQTASDSPLDEDWLAEYDGLSGCLRVEGMTGQVIDAPEMVTPHLYLPSISGDDPAYIFFTSGSTGKPMSNDN